MQEDNELKDMKIFEYEQRHLGKQTKIHIEAIEDKLKFLIQVFHRLKIMYVHGVKSRVQEIKEQMGVEEDDLEYPSLPIHEKIEFDLHTTLENLESTPM